MRRALVLAELGRGWVGPNPMVGAVVVRDGSIVGEGYHPEVGKPHAEVFALDQAGDRASGATLYVTLEPCNHFGRTPPCSQRVIASGVRRVVAATLDANPRTADQAEAVFAEAGIAFEAGLLGAEARELNAAFFKYIATGTPFVVCKMAMSLDGKIATSAGRSQWISGPDARDRVQRWRATYAAVMVGAGTVLADDPSLTCRIEGAHTPWRVVVDPRARTSPSARWIGSDGKAIVAVGPGADDRAVALLAGAGAEVLWCPQTAGGDLDLGFLMAALGRREIPSVLLEGGGGLNARAIRQGVVDRLRFFVAPLLIGGKSAPTPMDGPDIAQLADGVKLKLLGATPVGPDLLIEAEIPKGPAF